MLKRLRFQLTLLYLFLSLTLFVIVGAGAYSVLFYYFQSTADLALQYKAAREFQRYGLELPHELSNAQVAWSNIGDTAFNNPAMMLSRAQDDNQDGEETSDDHTVIPEQGDHFDASLSSIFVYTIMDGQVQMDAQYPNYPITPDNSAIVAATQKGYDWRTVRTSDNRRVRLLTYLLPFSPSPIIIQLGRLLNDQDRILSQFLLGMIVLSLGMLIFCGLVSWLLAGRSIAPAQRAWENQQAFVANASHELRTPLTLMRAAAELALRSHSPTDQGHLLGDIILDIDQMGKLVEDLLLLSRLDAGRLKLGRKPISLAPFLTDLHRQVERVAQGKNIHLSMGKADGTALGDVDRLRQVLLVLLDNAIRHTPQGGQIQLWSQVKGHTVLISVQDNGSGIAREHLPHVFERFYQVPGDRSDDTKGSGLGLSIAKSMLEAQKGSIQVQSRLGEGTCFTIILPQAA